MTVYAKRGIGFGVFILVAGALLIFGFERSTSIVFGLMAGLICYAMQDAVEADIKKEGWKTALFTVAVAASSILLWIIISVW